MIYIELFWSFFQIGLFSVGGGYAAMPLIQKQIVEANGWLTMSQFADVVTIAEMTPGPIAINSATFVGTMIAGLPGAVSATLGCVFPSCVIVMLLAYVYYRFRKLNAVQGVLGGLRPAVTAMIASAGISLLLTAVCGSPTMPTDIKGIDIAALVIFAGAFIALRRFKVSPIAVMAGAGAAGALLFSLLG